MSILDLIPGVSTLRTVAVAGVVASLASGGAYLWGQHKGAVAGRAEVQARWDVAGLRAAQDEAARRATDAAQAQAASAAHEAERARITSNLRKARDALSVALRSPISCPAGGDAALGDLVLPANVLDGVRSAASGGAPAPDH